MERPNNRNVARPAQAANANKEPEEIVASEEPIIADATVMVEIAADKMAAKITLIAPKMGGKPLAKEVIRNKLAEAGVTHGVKEAYLDRFVKYPIYGSTFIVAEGCLPQDGKDEELLCHFKTDISLAPKVLEDGSTDYKNIGFGSNAVKTGDLLAEILPAVPGADGYDVCGKATPSKGGKQIPPANGANVELREDGKLYAACDGNVSLKDGKVFVYKEMTLDQVDQSTGNVFFSGDVKIKGDVREGYSVRAGGSISVGGVVENATLIAMGDIIIKTGVHGAKADLNSGGTIKTAYVEMGKLNAKEAIFADVVLNGNLYCENKIVVSGKRAAIIGGRVKAGSLIETGSLGNSAYAKTTAIVADKEFENPIRDELNLKITDCSERLDILNDAAREVTSSTSMTMEEKRLQLKQIAEAKRDATIELQGYRVELSRIPLPDVPDGVGVIVVKGNVYPNCFLGVNGVEMNNSHQRPGCRITKKKDKLNFGSL